MVTSKIISSLEKCLPGASFHALVPMREVSVLKGERLSFQLAYVGSEIELPRGRGNRQLAIESDTGLYFNVRRVDYEPVKMPVYPDPSQSDDGYLSKVPGLFPDILTPLPVPGVISVGSGLCACLWIDCDIPSDMTAGEYTVTVKIRHHEDEECESSLHINIIDALLPEIPFKATQWFHCDCLADYYNVEIFSEEHWRIVENFASVAVRNGLNTLLTPIFTPPLDTAVGGERPTVQLVGVSKNGNNYSFDYTLLDRWIDMCNRVGVKYFEVSHLFTQWGAGFAPKICATVDGEYKRIFGWDTPAADGDYPVFLRQFLPDFIQHMKDRGCADRCIFHISDEPNTKNLESYTKSKNIVADLLKGFTTIDALSNVEFWQTGVVETPVAANNHIQPFIDAGVPHLWAYYCCGQGSGGVSNRFIAMPGARTRFMGVQMYKYAIEGFLQWGYNFYYNQGSVYSVNPYEDPTGDFFVPGGDTFSVYPAKDGHAIESMRIVHFHEGLQDMRALYLAEKLTGRDKVLDLLRSECGDLTFGNSLTNSQKMLALREKINKFIANNI